MAISHTLTKETSLPAADSALLKREETPEPELVSPFDTDEEDEDEEDEFYPSSDGKPMGETDRHIDLILDGKATLFAHFLDRPDVYVAGNNFIYFEEGNPRAVVSPDGYVVFGVEKKQRDTYKVWEEEGRTPAVVLEYTSRKTRREDNIKKRFLYESVLSVPEYFQFDPTGIRKKARLKGWRLVQGKYEPIELRDNRMFSEQLQLELVQEGIRMRFYDPGAGRYLLNPAEQALRTATIQKQADAEARGRLAEVRARKDAERRADRETKRAETAEAELARLRAELERLQGQSGV